MITVLIILGSVVTYLAGWAYSVPRVARWAVRSDIKDFRKVYASEPNKKWLENKVKEDTALAMMMCIFWPVFVPFVLSGRVLAVLTYRQFVQDVKREIMPMPDLREIDS